MRESMKHLTAFTAYFSFNQKCKKKKSCYVGCIPVKITEMHTQLVKNPPAMKETLVCSLGRKIHWRRERLPTLVFLGFPGGSDHKESTCNAGDLGLIPGLGRFPGGGKATHTSILAWKIQWTEKPGGLQSLGSQRAGMTEWLSLSYLLGSKPNCSVLFKQHSKLKRIYRTTITPQIS